jgi:MFS family permease
MTASTSQDSSRWRELFEPQYLAATATLCLGVALFAFNVFFVATAMPSAIRELGGEAFIAWTFALYLVFAIASGAAAAPMQARFGTRSVFFVAAALFVVGTLISASAGTMAQVLAGRALQGAAAGPIEALCYTLIPVLFPSRLVPKVFGAEAVCWAAAAFGGPAIAGYITEAWSWRGAFLVSLPLVTIFAVLVYVIVPKDETKYRDVSFPGLRVILIGLGILAICVAGIASLWLSAVLIVGAVVLLCSAVRIDRASPHPLLPRAAFTFAAPVGFGFWTIVLMAMAESSSAVFLVYGAQHVWGYSAVLAGAIGSVLAVSWSGSQILLASLAGDELRRRLIWVGAALLFAALVLMVVGFSVSNIVIVVVAQIMIGVSFGINWASLSQYLMEAVDEHERNVTAAFLPTSQSAGFAIGDALVGLIANLAGFATAKSANDIRQVLIVVFACGAAIAFPAIFAAWKAVRNKI